MGYVMMPERVSTVLMSMAVGLCLGMITIVVIVSLLILDQRRERAQFEKEMNAIAEVLSTYTGLPKKGR